MAKKSLVKSTPREDVSFIVAFVALKTRLKITITSRYIVVRTRATVCFRDLAKLNLPMVVRF